MTILSKIFSDFFLVTPEEKDIVKNEIFDANIQRILTLSFLGIPTSLMHVLIFYLKFPDRDPAVFLWQKGIMASHIFLIILFSFFAIFVRLIKSKKISLKYMYFLVPLIYLIFLFIGTVISAIDQLVTTSITPFLVVTTIISFLIFIPPAISLIFFILSYINFYFLIGYYQPLENVVLSNRVNGVTITGIGFGISFILWRMAMTNFKQQRQILKQNEDLKENYEKLQSLSSEFERLSRIDELTGLANRRSIQEYLEREWNRARRENYRICIALADIDFFKKYNDLYGHLAGDRCLREIAETLQKSFRRSTDLVGRYGGEEFIIVMPNFQNSLLKLNDVMKNIADLNIPHDSSSISSRVTISIGLACLNPEEDNSPDDLIQLADEALYAAKKKGRDNIVAGKMN